MTEKFENDVLEAILDFEPAKTDPRHRQRNNPGPSVSSVLGSLRERGWKNLGNHNSDFEALCEEAGFTIVVRDSRFFVTL